MELYQARMTKKCSNVVCRTCNTIIFPRLTNHINDFGFDVAFFCLLRLPIET